MKIIFFFLSRYTPKVIENDKDVQKLTGKRVQITFDCINREMDRRKIKDFFENYARVKSVHYTKLQVQGYVKFVEEEKLEEALHMLLNKKLTIGGTKCSIKIINLTTFIGNNLDKTKMT